MTLLVESDHAADVALLDDWLDRWSPRLAACSDNLGCGCCVDVFEVDAPAEALAELPERFFCASDAASPPPTLWQRLTSGFR